METICMKCQMLFPGKNKKNVIILSSAELTQRVVNVEVLITVAADDILMIFVLFIRKQALSFHVNCLLSIWLTRNAKSYFLCKIIFKNLDCCHATISLSTLRLKSFAFVTVFFYKDVYICKSHLRIHVKMYCTCICSFFDTKIPCFHCMRFVFCCRDRLMRFLYLCDISRH